MAAIKVHGNPGSTATRRVLATLYEKDLDFEFVLVNMVAREHKSEAYLKLNPFGQVPAFEDGDLKLIESRAIAQYVATEYSGKGTDLICLDGRKQKAILLKWIEVESHQFDPTVSRLLRETVLKPKLGMETDKAAVEENEGKLVKLLDVYEARLSESKYLACDCFTLADLLHLPALCYLLDTPYKTQFESRPHVAAWVAAITSRPAWAKVLAMQ